MSGTTDIVRTALGDVEAEASGAGIPVLCLHGSPGGIDAARMMGRFLPPDRFRRIAFSRPGYLGTPLHPTDASIDREADLIAALLDELGLRSAAVLAWSGGGPAGYRLAVRHPDRVSSMAMVAALSGTWDAPSYPATDRFLFGTIPGGWLVRLLALAAPAQIVGGALASEGSVRGEELRTLTASVMADPVQRADVLAAARTMSWAGRRRAGWDNDVANDAAISSLELSRVRAPVLLVHGDADTDVDPAYSARAHEELPTSTLVMMERGTHLSLYAHPDARRAQRRVTAWFEQHR